MGAQEQAREAIRIGGQDFLEVTEGTIAQDLRFASLVARCGIEEIVRQDGENASSFARRILERVLAGGEVLELLACLLVPARAVGPGQEPGEVWNQELADQTKTFLGSLPSGGEDGLVVRGLVIQLLLHFFERGIVSLWTSPSSSAIGDPGEKNGDERTSPTRTAGESGDPGPTSSSSSPARTSTESIASSAGRSGRPS